MMSKATLIRLLIIIFVGGGIYAYFIGTTKKDSEPQDIKVIEPIVLKQESKQWIVTYTNSGFFPDSLIIKKGDTVIFENKSSRNVWVASATHPSHREYPGTDAQKCGTEEAGSMFDACRGVSPEASWSFVFSNVGMWKYHNHLNIEDFGSIIVE